MFPGHLVCGFVGISGRNEPRVLPLPAATAAKLDLVYVHDTMMLLFYTLFLSQCDVNSFLEPKQNRPFCDSHHICVSGCRVPRQREPIIGSCRDAASVRLEENGLNLEQTRSRDHDSCHEGRKAREQQQFVKDDGHRKSCAARTDILAGGEESGGRTQPVSWIVRF